MSGAASHTPRSIAPIGPLLRTVLDRAGARVWAAVGLMVVAGLTSGVTVVLIIPLVQAAGVPAAPADSSWLFRAVAGLTSAVTGLPVALGLLVAAVAAQGVVRWLDATAQAAVAQDVMMSLRRQLVRRLTAVDWVEFSRRRSADLLDALTRQVDRVGHAVHDVLGLVAAAITASTYVLLALTISPTVTGLVLALGSALSLALARARRRAGEAGHALTAADRELHRGLDAALSGMKLVRSHGLEARQVGEIDRVLDPLRRVHLRLAGQPALVRLGFDTGIAAIVAAGVFVALRATSLGAADVLVLLVVFVRLAPQLSTLQVYAQMLVAEAPAHAALEQLDRELAAAAVPTTQPAAAAFSGAVAFDRVGFAYDHDAVLEDVTLDVPAGLTVAIVGASGAGKTTLADLVLGLLSPREGQVLVDGRPLTPATAAGWRRAIGYVPQDPFLFHDTIRRNLMWAAPEADDDAIWAALDAAAAGFVRQFPDGLETVVGDRGARLSAGERQRLALARALLRRPRLLVLDEATSALDSEHERAIQHAVRRLHGRVTVLAIAHRLSTIRDADCIYVLDHGRVVESGSWSTLMARPAGRLRALAAAQGVEPAPSPAMAASGQS